MRPVQGNGATPQPRGMHMVAAQRLAFLELKPAHANEPFGSAMEQ